MRNFSSDLCFGLVFVLMECVNNSMFIFFLDKNYPVPPAVRKRGRSDESQQRKKRRFEDALGLI